MRADTDGAEPRERSDGLGWVTTAVFPDDRLRLELCPNGRAATGSGRLLALYAVVPSIVDARFLLPLASPRVSAAATLAYNALRPVRVRAGRAAVGTLARLGLLGLARMPVLAVSAPSGTEPAEVMFTCRLAAALGHRRLHAAIGVRPPDPHHKPTLQLFDDAGRPAGYAKIGWNAATRAMARAEADALANLPRPGGDHPDAPRLLWRDSHAGREVTVVEPMPPGVRRIRRPDVPRLAAMRAVARRGGPGGPTQPLHGSPFHRRLADRVTAVDGPARVVLDALINRDAGTRVEFGSWHGDWVPWNLARHGGRLFAWDWENSGHDVPLGFDLAHQAFQIALAARHPVPAAAAAMDEALGRHGPGLDLGPEQRRTVADGYLLEFWLRLADLARGGGGWNPRLYPAVPDLLCARLGLG